jgi:hypothetical protein
MLRELAQAFGLDDKGAPSPVEWIGMLGAGLLIAYGLLADDEDSPHASREEGRDA